MTVKETNCCNLISDVKQTWKEKQYFNKTWEDALGGNNSTNEHATELQLMQVFTKTTDKQIQRSGIY